MLREMFRKEAARRCLGSGDRALLYVAEDYSWFQLGAAQPVDIRRKWILKGLLEALMGSMGEGELWGLSRSELIAQLWPEYSTNSPAIRNRLHVALHGLRSLGLRSHLAYRNDRYGLDIEVRRVRSTQPSAIPKRATTDHEPSVLSRIYTQENRTGV